MCLKSITNIFMVDPSNFTIPYDVALCEGLRSAGGQVRLFGRSSRAHETSLANTNFEAFFYRREHRYQERSYGQLLKGMEHVVDNVRFLKLVRKARPYLVHFQWGVFPLVDAQTFRAIRSYSPVILTLHDTHIFNGTPSSKIQNLGYMNMVQQTDGLLVHSEKSAEVWVSRGIEPSRVHVVPHGHLSGLAPVARSEDPGRKLIAVLFGKMRPYKGLDVLVSALAQLDQQSREKIQVVIAGEPLMDLAPVRSAIHEARLDNVVELRPWFHSDAETSELLGAADLFLFPYTQIDASGVLYLTLPLKKPVIATATGCFIEEVVEGVNGLLSPPGDASAMAVNIESYLNDQTLRSRLADGAVNAASGNGDWRPIAAKTLEIYAATRAKWSRAEAR